MSYQTASEFARSWGLVFLMIMFAAAVVYAMWPSNRTRFEEAARLPLDDGEDA